MAASLDDLATKVETGEPLSDADVEALAASRDIIALGMLASTVRRKIHGSDVTFVRVADLKLDDLQRRLTRAGNRCGRFGSFRRRLPSMPLLRSSPKREICRQNASVGILSVRT